MASKIQEAEIIGRGKCIQGLQQLLPQFEYHQTPVQEHYDIWFMSGDTKVLVETKDRDNLSTTYDDDMLNGHKY